MSAMRKWDMKLHRGTPSLGMSMSLPVGICRLHMEHKRNALSERKAHKKLDKENAQHPKQKQKQQHNEVKERFFEGEGIDVAHKFSARSPSRSKEAQHVQRLDKLLTLIFPGLTRQYLLFLIESGHVKLVYKRTAEKGKKGDSGGYAVVERKKALKVDPSKLDSVEMHLQPRHGASSDTAFEIVTTADGNCAVVDEQEQERLEEEIHEIEKERVIFRNEHVLVWNKESGKAVHPSQGHPYKTTVLSQVQQYCGKRRWFDEIQEDGQQQRQQPQQQKKKNFPLRVAFAHRLDRDTSGALVAGISSHAVQFLSEQFSTKPDNTKKQYLAVCTFAKGVLPNTIKHEKREVVPSDREEVWIEGDYGLDEDLGDDDVDGEEAGTIEEDNENIAALAQGLTRSVDGPNLYENYHRLLSRAHVRAEDEDRPSRKRKTISQFANDDAYPLLENEYEEFSFVESSYRRPDEPFKEYLVIDQPIIPIRDTGVMYSMGTKDEIDAELSRRSVEREKTSRSVVQILDINERKKLALVLVNIHTGRTHQVRTHLSSISLPVLGDYKYGLSESRIPIMAAQRLGVQRVMLHCRKLSFKDPIDDGKRITVVAPMSDDLRQIITSSFHPLKVQRLLKDEEKFHHVNS